MNYDDANKAKANFNAVYQSPTPHAYLERMSECGYEISEQARPYCVAASEFVRERVDDPSEVQMLDVGCSYGIGAASVKYGRSFPELVSFVTREVPEAYEQACKKMRAWLNKGRSVQQMRCVGLDSSKPAIRFARDAGLIDAGIAGDFEQNGMRLPDPERNLLSECNLMMSTGAIGYFGERTLNAILPSFRDGPKSQPGPFAVMTILRMFDIDSVRTCFEKHGLRFGKVPDVLLPQRRFADKSERAKVLSVLHSRGLDTHGLEDSGKHFAELYVATPPRVFEQFRNNVRRARRAN
jgi:carnitine O-acetyltransferase